MGCSGLSINLYWPKEKEMAWHQKRITQGVTLQDSRTFPAHSLLGMSKECCKHCGASSTRYLKVTWPEKPLLSNLLQSSSEYTNCYDSGILTEKGWSLLRPQATSEVTWCWRGSTKAERVSHFPKLSDTRGPRPGMQAAEPAWWLVLSDTLFHYVIMPRTTSHITCQKCQVHICKWPVG